MHVPAETILATSGELHKEATLWKANAAAELIVLEGESNKPELRIGRVINVSGEGLGSENMTSQNFGMYRIISLSHFVDGAGNYSNSFTAVPHFLDVPPLRPGYSAPHGSPELAEVIDDQDPKKLGRLRVRYYWPVQDPQQAETSWLRVLTPYSGDGKGHLMKPEVGSQVLVGYQSGLAEQPFVMGNMFHGNNKQGATYSPDKNSLKGIQTAGGNKVVMLDTKGEQKVLISNSNNKGTAVEVGFKGDGTITIKSNGPVTVLGSSITLEAGDKGEIKLHAKNITMQAEDDIIMDAKTKGIALTAKDKMALTAKDLLAVGSTLATVQSRTELALHGGGKATLQSGDTKVH